MGILDRLFVQPAEAEPLFDEALFARLRQLQLRVRQRPVHGLAGKHQSRRHGSSPEFSDFKRYMPGDDFRRIDWNVYARMGSLFVRLSEIQTEVTIHVLLDTSGSMDWGTPPKFTYARRLVAALSYLGLWHFDRVTVVPFADTIRTPFGPSLGRSATGPLLQYLERLTPGGETDLTAIIQGYLHAHRRRGAMILVSDLLSDDIDGALRLLGERGWEVSVIHVLDEAELEPDLVAEQELFDLETGERLRVAPTRTVLDAYRAGVESWLATCEAACDASRASYLRVLTSWPIDELLLRTLRHRGVIG